MSLSKGTHNQAVDTPAARKFAPQQAIGWWTLGLSMLGLAAWIILPMITIAFRNRYPITDTWVMPAIGLIFTDLAALLNVLCIWYWKERSILNMISAVLIIPISMFVTLMVVGEGLAGV